MNLGDQGTCGVERNQVAPGRLFGDRPRHPVRRKDDRRLAIRNFTKFLDEDGALGTQAVDYIAVVHDFMANIDGRSIH